VRDMPNRTQVLLHPETGQVLETVTNGLRYLKPEGEMCTLVLSEPIRVRVMQRMFADYAAGVPIRVLRDNLNKAGLRTARGRIFTVATIHSMLDNPAYAGMCVYNQRTESKWHRHTEGRSVERLDEGLEIRPESDWIVKPNAWPAIVDQETFAQVQQRRKASKQNHVHLCGTAIRANFLLSPQLVCGVCGGRMTGQTTTSGKGYRTRYYICKVHHSGDHERCPKRYKIPADIVEQHILGLIQADLAGLKNDTQLHQYVVQEVARLTGGADDTRQQMQRRLADLDQQVAKLKDHLKSVDAETAKMLGLYEDAKTLTAERQVLEQQLCKLGAATPEVPKAEEIRARVCRELERFQDIFAEGSLDQKREMIRLYVPRIKADPTTEAVEISLYPTLFTQIVAGGGFEPPTSGL